MAHEYDGRVVPLMVEEGNKPGQPIATYVVGRRERYLVFMPTATKDHVGKAVKVKLVDTGRTDGRGMVLFRGEPTPDEYSSRWRDNGDATASKVTIATSWLGEQSEAGVEETIQLIAQEAPEAAISRTDRVVVWGTDLASSVVMEEQVKTIPTRQQAVSAEGALSWTVVSNREERDVPQAIPVTAVTMTSGLVLSSWQRVQYPDSDRVDVRADFAGGFSGWHVTDGTTWGKLPQWIRDQHCARFPVCTCGRQRREAQVADGYSKCELCRAEETCVRCSKKAKVKNLSGRLVCADCEPYESMEEMIGRLLKQEQRQSLAEEARRLADGQALAQPEGEAILELTLDHVESSYTKQRLLQNWKGYQWYYFTPKGVYGTKLAPAALTILEFLPQASGNGLVELVAWLAVQPKSRNDYYTATQVAGVAMPISQVLSAMQASLGSGTLRLADRLRGSEQDRTAALEKHRKFQMDLVEGRIILRSHESNLIADALKMLQAQEQNYGKVLELLQQIETRLALRAAAIASGEIWVDVTIHVSTDSRTQTDVFAIAPDGSLIEAIGEDRGGRRDRYVSAYHYGDLPNNVLVVSHSHDNYGHRETEAWEVHYVPKHVSEVQRTTLQRIANETRHYFAGSGTGWDLRQIGRTVFSTPYRNTLDDREAYLNQEMCSQFPIDVTQYEQTIGEEGTIVIGPHRRRSREAKVVQEAEDAELEARGLVMTLGYDKEEAQATYESAQEEWLKRDDIKDGSCPVEDGTVFLVSAFVRETREGREDLVFGPFFDWASGMQVKLVLDPFSGESQRITEQNQNVLVHVRPRNSEQVHLFETFLRPQAGGHKQRTLGYFVIPVLSPEDLDWQIAEAEEQHRLAEEALERARRAADYIAAKKRAETEETRTVAEEPTTFYSSDPAESLNSLADKLKAALEGWQGK